MYEESKKRIFLTCFNSYSTDYTSAGYLTYNASDDYWMNNSEVKDFDENDTKWWQYLVFINLLDVIICAK